MARNQISFEILDEILDSADLYLTPPDERGYSSDEVTLRPVYSGKGYSPAGFAVVLESEEALRAFLAGAGLAQGARRADGIPGFDVLTFVRRTETDSMGHGIIACWPDWEVTGLPEIYTKD